MTALETAVALEIVRIGKEALAFEDEGALLAAAERGEALASALDSLQRLSLVVAVEDRFRIVLSEEDAAGTRTLADLARLVVLRADATLLPLAAAAAGKPAP
ncbi:MAG: acyl carrier protein [Anaeromyxobacteraceae bacterium]